MVFDFPAPDLGGGEVEIRTMERQIAAVDTEMRQKLVQMYEEEDINNELG